MIENWHIWLILALIFILIEIFTSGFGIICFAFGAIISALIGAFGLGLDFQIGAFCVFSGFSFITIRPLLLRYFSNRKRIHPTNTDALIGRTVIVEEPIEGMKSGRVKIDGDSWRAVCAEKEPIQPGEYVTVIKIDSTILTVKKSEL